MQQTHKASFAEFGKHFQEVWCQALLVDHNFAGQMLEVFDDSYVDLKYLSFLASRFFDYGKKYKIFPSLPLLLTIVKDDLKKGTDVVVRDQIVDYLQRIRSEQNLGDLQFVKEKSLDFCRRQALRRALETAVDQLQAEKYEQIVETIKKAVSVGTTPSLGHDFFADYEERFSLLKRDCIPTGLPELDKQQVLNGGMGKGELFVIAAGAGVGKSHFMVMLGANAMRQGCDVLHYTMELSETQVGVRYDSNLCDIDSTLVLSSKDKVLAQYEEMRKTTTLGRLFVKQYPTNTASIHTIRAHMERLKLHGFVPDLVIVDYADIMRSTRQYESLRHELKLVYEELRGLAMEEQIPVVTASQSNKEGTNSDIVDLSNLSEAYGKAAVADCVITLSRRAHEKASGHGRLFLAKNRAGQDGLLYSVKIDTAKSKMSIVGHSSFEEASVDDDNKLKAAIREKLREVNDDPELRAQKLSNGASLSF